jgi:hypothetical protein
MLLDPLCEGIFVASQPDSQRGCLGSFDIRPLFSPAKRLLFSGELASVRATGDAVREQHRSKLSREVSRRRAHSKKGRGT